MIWHTEELTCLKQPDGVTLTITGTFNIPGSNLPIILLRLIIKPKFGEIIIKTLMEKNPSFLSYEEPNPDEIQAKYYRKVLLARDKILKTPYQDILYWK